MLPTTKDGDVWGWFGENRHWLEVHQLPPYSPELNPTERLWQYTRRTGAHNRYFSQPADLLGTLTRVFGDMQRYPELIRPYLQSFCGNSGFVVGESVQEAVCDTARDARS